MMRFSPGVGSRDEAPFGLSVPPYRAAQSQVLNLLLAVGEADLYRRGDRRIEKPRIVPLPVIDVGERTDEVLPRRQILEDDPPGPRRLDASIPRDLEAICLKCLEKQPARRYATAQELADDYWLYVVLDCASPSPRLYRVQDPARTLAAAWSASHEVRFRVDPEPVIAAGSGEAVE